MPALDLSGSCGFGIAFAGHQVAVLSARFVAVMRRTALVQ